MTFFGLIPNSFQKHHSVRALKSFRSRFFIMSRSFPIPYQSLSATQLLKKVETKKKHRIIYKYNKYADGLRFFKELHIRSNAFIESSHAFNFTSNKPWFIVWKTFERSINKTQIFLPLSKALFHIFLVWRLKNVVFDMIFEVQLCVMIVYLACKY